MNSTSTNLFIYCLMFDMLHFLMESEFLSTNNWIDMVQSALPCIKHGNHIIDGRPMECFLCFRIYSIVNKTWTDNISIIYTLPSHIHLYTEDNPVGVVAETHGWCLEWRDTDHIHKGFHICLDWLLNRHCSEVPAPIEWFPQRTHLYWVIASRKKGVREQH